MLALSSLIARQALPQGQRCLTRGAFQNSSDSGRIETIVGPMFSGKTTELFRRIRRFRWAKKSVVTIKFEDDTRYDRERAATHDRVTEEALGARKLQDLLPELADKDVVGIDEGHFFPDLAEVADELANQGKIVLVAALDADFRREPFPEVARLIAKSETVEKLDAVCIECGDSASFSKRISSEQQLHLVGGADKYACMCRSCYQKQPKASRLI